MFWATILFAVAVSLDGLGVGISYGMRKIKIPWQSLIVICLSSTIALAISMLAGNVIASFISPQIAELIGGLALLLVGGWLFIQGLVQRLEKNMKATTEEHGQHTVFKLSIPCFGLVIKILKEPAQADFDASGVISVNEAVFLGFALAMDALGAGLGAAMMGFHPWFTPLVAGISKLILVSLGLYIGSQSVKDKLKGNLGLLPGFIIMFIGALKVVG